MIETRSDSGLLEGPFTRKKMRGRWYHKVDNDFVTAGDIIIYNDDGLYTRVVKSVSKKTVMVDQPEGLKPKTKRVDREDIRECWRKRST